MLQILLGKFLSVPFISGILQPFITGLLTAQKQKLDAGNTREAIHADLAKREFDLEQREREVQAQLLIVEQGNWMTRWVRPLWALPFVIWTWDVVVFGYVLQWRTTPDLKGSSATLLMMIAGCYFLGRSGEKIATTLKR